VLYYSSRSNYLMHSNFQNGLSDFSAGGLLRNLSKRRGYFGDYMADIPGENTFHIKRQDGTPIHNAEVWVYQQQDNIVPNIPKFRGTTDAQGYYTFPHVTDTLYEGGITVANPFSTIHSPAPHVVGTNSVLFVRVTKGDSVGYRFIDICDFNVAYWSGNQNAATHPLKISRWFNILPAGLEETENSIPKTYQLFQNYPNPFNPATEIKYQLPKASEVKLAIYNVLGEKVRILVQEKKDPGVHHARWDGINDHGIPLSSGIYFYRLSAGNYESVRKMILIR
jgi:hypothetical protein